MEGNLLTDCLGGKEAWRTVGQIPKKCRQSHQDLGFFIDMVYFSFVSLLKLILYNSKPQNQMCD